MKKVFRILLWVFIGLVFAGTLVFLYLNSRTPEESYATMTPSRGDIERSTVLTGKIEPRDEIAIKPQISGIISEILVEAGENVKEGEKKVISREDYETSEKTYRKAKEELESAKDAYNIVRQGVSKYNASESNTLVRATITGLVLDVPVKVGSSVIQANTMNDGTTIATVADMNKLIFRGKVDETEVGSLRIGMPMDISIGAMPDLKPLATIEYISPKGDDTSGANSFEIKAALIIDNPEGLRAGYSANATVILEQAKNVITVPESTVTFEGDSTFVYVLTDSIKKEYARRPISTGLSDGINIEVKSGIDSTAVLRGAKMM